MKITEIRSDKVYNKILNASLDKKDDIYRYELMNEFAYKWSCYNVPIKAKQKGGYDVIMASSMLGYMAPSEIDESKIEEVKGISHDSIWKLCTDMETLNDYVKPIIKDNLNVQGLEGITAYLYGDEIANAQGYFPEGLPFCAGYACGYHMIKYYLEKTGKSIIEATLMPYEEIKKELSGFWEL